MLAARRLTGDRRRRTAARLPLVALDAVVGLDLAIDGADQIDPSGWLIKGGGAAHTRQKIVVAAARRFIVIASSNKLVERLRPPLPLELLPFAPVTTMAAIGSTRACQSDRARGGNPGDADGRHGFQVGQQAGIR
jgi:ribose 5-phosphate isomerase A